MQIIGRARPPRAPPIPTALVFNPEKCGNVCPGHYVIMFSVTGSMLEIYFTLSPQKQVTDVSLVLKDSDTESVDRAFCIRWPENRRFKSCIIYRYIIKCLINVDTTLWRLTDVDMTLF